MRFFLTFWVWLLVLGLYRKMEVYRPHRADAEEMAKFHTPEYIDFLRRLTGGHDAGMQVFGEG